jgi:hypothetical protein
MNNLLSPHKRPELIGNPSKSSLLKSRDYRSIGGVAKRAAHEQWQIKVSAIYLGTIRRHPKITIVGEQNDPSRYPAVLELLAQWKQVAPEYDEKIVALLETSRANDPLSFRVSSCE